MTPDYHEGCDYMLASLQLPVSPTLPSQHSMDYQIVTLMIPPALATPPLTLTSSPPLPAGASSLIAVSSPTEYDFLSNFN